LEQRYTMKQTPHAHLHVHDGGMQHVHDHTTYVKPMQPPRLGRRAPLLASMLAALLCLAGFAAHAIPWPACWAISPSTNTAD